jgi:hypothetical protein
LHPHPHTHAHPRHTTHTHTDWAHGRHTGPHRLKRRRQSSHLGLLLLRLSKPTRGTGSHEPSRLNLQRRPLHTHTHSHPRRLSLHETRLLHREPLLLLWLHTSHHGHHPLLGLLLLHSLVKLRLHPRLGNLTQALPGRRDLPCYL